MTALWPRLASGDDETPLSLVSRLARLHGKPIRTFCSDLGLRLTELVDGRRDVILRLADLAGVPSERLLANAMVRVGHRDHEWRGEAMGHNNLRRLNLRACPLCLQEDEGHAATLPGPGAHGRAAWLVRYIRTCDRHHVALVELPSSYETQHDFASAVVPLLQRLASPGYRPIPRKPSHFERYLLDRLRGRPDPRTAWLNGLAFAAAADTCEAIGSIVAFGRKIADRLMGDGAWHAVGEMGFEVARDGPAAIREMLAVWQRDTGKGNVPGTGGLHALGNLLKFLAPDKDRPDLDPVRDVVADHIMRTTPLVAGDVVLGRKVPERLVQTISSASLEFGLAPRIVRKVLREAGVIGPATDRQHVKAVRFSVTEARPFLEAAKAPSLTGGEIGRYLGVPKDQVNTLAASGLIPALVGGPQLSGLRVRKFARSDLDAFLERLGRGAQDVVSPGAGEHAIAYAASIVRRPTMDVLRLVLEGRLDWVGRRTGLRGYGAILVRTAEVRRLVGVDDPDAWTSQQVAAQVGLNYLRVLKLIRAGLIPARSVGRPEGTHKTWSVAKQDALKFRATYATAAQIGSEWGMSTKACSLLISKLGIVPAFADSWAGTNTLVLYLRADIPCRPA